MVFNDDPDKQERNEDPQLAWSMKMFLDDPEHLDPKKVLIFPMVKASM
jgi:PhoPQ-activated pathogenicity-related protein